MVIPREICTFTTSYFSISIPFEKKRSISCGNGVVESKVNARAEETHTMVRAILSLRGNDNTWLHTLLHADTSVPLLLWENTDILSSGCVWTNSECKNVLKERQTYRERIYVRTIRNHCLFEQRIDIFEGDVDTVSTYRNTKRYLEFDRLDYAA